MPILYILCGPSGSGKSTWAHNFIREKDPLYKNIRDVSRDEIRLSMLKDGEDYFAHEKEVVRKFTGTIVQTLVDGFDVIADATHITRFSRRKLTQIIDMHYTDYKIIMVVFTSDPEVCVERNKNRTGRANVPENVIRNMCRDFRAPTYDEDERIIDIWEV